ncbi:MAG: hypothetical protein WC809_08250 [Sinimarinibacterium sp.]|jgi:hypothetical protein
MTDGCPKCGYVRRPQDRSAPGECPSCGVFYEKYRQRQLRLTQSVPHAPDDVRDARISASSLASRAWAALWTVPDRVDQTAFAGRCAALALVVVWGLWFAVQPWSSEAIGSSFLHSVNLPFHEFGHVLFRPFGEWMTFLGGSLFQCLWPMLIGGYFVFKGQPFSASICLWWSGQNFIDVAPYIGDARALSLPLIGEWSEEMAEFRAYRHDWHNILASLGWLGHDHSLARLSKFTGVLIMLLSWIWGGLLLRRQYARLSGDVFNERG